MVSSAAPDVSLLLPVRDAAPWLEPCLADLRAQVGVSFEVIAVDDGSRDATPELLERAARADGRIRWISTPGHGAASALNRALDEARAPRIGHMEGDDRCPPDRLRRLCAALDEVPGHDAVTSGVELCGAATAGMSEYVGWQNGLQTPDAHRKNRFVEIPALHQTGLYRADVLHRLRFREPRRWPLDIDFWMRFFDAGFRVAKLPERLYTWRQHPLQSTRTSPRHRLERLRECKAHWFARGPAAGRRVLLVSVGRTRDGWRNALAREGVVVRAPSFRPGEALPVPIEGEVRLFAFGREVVRRRLERQAGFDARDDWFAA